jgi:glycosyltransferase involved in cell wall biosynthesis
VPEVRTANAGIEVRATVPSIQTGLDQLLSSASLRTASSKGALLAAQQFFSWDVVGAETESLFREVARDAR